LIYPTKFFFRTRYENAPKDSFDFFPYAINYALA